MWVFPKIGVPQNGWFIRENPIKMDELGGNTPYQLNFADFLRDGTFHMKFRCSESSTAPDPGQSI